MDLTATMGVAGARLLGGDARFRAPDSRKPDWRAAERRSWAWGRDAVRMWRIYFS